MMFIYLIINNFRINRSILKKLNGFFCRICSKLRALKRILSKFNKLRLLKILKNRKNCRSIYLIVYFISILELRNDANNIYFDITRCAYLKPSFFVFISN